MLARYEEELGKELVENAMALLALSNGLTEVQLVTSLALLSEVRGNREMMTANFDILEKKLNPGVLLPKRRLSQIKLSILLNEIQSFLQPTASSLMEGILLVKEGQWFGAVAERYFRGPLRPDTVHKVLACTFAATCKDSDLAGMDPMSLIALSYHLATVSYTHLTLPTIYSV